MRKITEQLSSMRLTMWTLVFLILWVGIAFIIAESESFSKEFRIMNNMHVREWLFSGDTGAAVVKAWFIILCAAMTVMGVNLIFCSWNKIFKIMKVKKSARRLFMLIVHGLFGFVALGHLGGLTLGFEHCYIRLQEGEEHTIKEGYRIEVNKIHFAGNIKALSRGNRNITADELDYRNSYAEVSLSKGDELLLVQEVRLLAPMRHGDVQVTLNSFTQAKDQENDPDVDVTAACMFMLSRNPALKPFLIIYPVMVAGIFIYLIITWRKSLPNQSKNIT